MMAKEPNENMNTLESKCGRFSISHITSSNFAEVTEYDGAGPRRILNRMQIPVEFLAPFMKEKFGLTFNEDGEISLS